MTIFGIKHLVIELDTLEAIVHRDDRARFAAFIEAHRRAKAPRTLEYRIVGAHGELAWIHSVCKLQYDIDGQPSRLVGTARDITAHKHRDEQLCKALVEKEVLLRAIEQMREVRRQVVETPGVRLAAAPRLNS